MLSNEAHLWLIDAAKRSASSYHVFVYGTLRKGEANHHVLAGSTRLASQCRIKGHLYDTGVGYPALVESTDGYVYGELYEVHRDIIPALDLLEDYAGPQGENLYDRVVQTVETDTGNVTAVVYTQSMNQVEGLVQVPFDDWYCRHFAVSDREGEPSYYFAYGSAMDSARIEAAGVLPLFQDVVGRGVVDGFTLQCRFRSQDGGRADLVELGGVAEGKVYRITKTARDYLFEREGVFVNAYRPTFVDVDTVIGQVRALTFLVIDKVPELAPPMWYWEECLRGAYGTVSDEYYHMLERKYVGLA